MSNWTVEKEFYTYEEAAQYKKDLLDSERGAMLQVKIKKYWKGFGKIPYSFGIKVRKDPSLIAHEEEINSKSKKAKGK